MGEEQIRQLEERMKQYDSIQAKITELTSDLMKEDETEETSEIP